MPQLNGDISRSKRAHSKKSKETLGKELRIWFLLLALFPLTLVSTISYFQASQSLFKAAKNDLIHSAALNKNFINNWMYYRYIDTNNQAKAKNNVALMTSLSSAWQQSGAPLKDFVYSYKWTETVDSIQQDLLNFSQQYDYIYDVLLIDLKGNVLYSLLKEDDFGSNLLINKAPQPKFSAAIEKSINTGKMLFSGIERYEPSDNIIAGFITAPLIAKNGDKVGVIAIQITLDRIFSVLKKASSSNSSLKHYLVAEDGLLRTPYESEQWQDVLHKKIDTKQFNLWLKEHGTDGEHKHDQVGRAFEYIGPNKKMVIGIHQSIEVGDLKWALFSEINQDEALEPANLIRKITFVLLAFTIVIVFFMAKVISRKITTPLTTLAQHSLEIAKNESATTVNIISNNEIGQLAEAFNYMVQARQANIEELKHSNQEAQETLQALNEQKFALDQHAIVTITDLKGTIIFANQKFSDISGYEVDELIGQNHNLLNSHNQPKSYWKAMYQTIKTGEVWRDEVRNKRKDGSLYWVDTTIVPFMGDNEKPKRYIAIRTDITKLKQAKLALSENARQLELVVASTDVGIWDWKIAQQQIHCNPRWYEITGYSEQELSPITVDKCKLLVHPQDIPFFIDVTEKYLLGESQTYSFELRIKHKQGHWLWVNGSGKIVERTKNNSPARMIGTLLDITPLKTAQFEQEKVNQQIAVKLAISQYLSQPGRLISKLKLTLKTLLKFEHANFTGKAGIGIFDQKLNKLNIDVYYGDINSAEKNIAQHHCQVNGHYDRIINSGKFSLLSTEDSSGSQYVFPLVSKVDNQVQKLGLLFIYTKNQNLPDEPTLALLHEICDMLSIAILREKARSLLKEASKSAEQSSQLKSEFLASMSHEIRTPMNGVLGMLGLLLKSNLNDEQRHKATLANSSAQSLLTLINDILDFSKIEAGKLELENIDFNLRCMLEDFSESMAHKAQSKGLEIVLDVKGVEQPMVKGDQGRIRQILTNLVSNAIKFTHDGEIVIRAKTTINLNKKMIFNCIIEDTGIGIPGEKLASLFDTFSQVDASTTREYGGTGLGLSICKNLAELMNGYISVCSILGQGSTFAFNVEVQASQHAQPVFT